MILHAPIPEKTEQVAREIVDAGFQFHAALGPGLLESAYRHCLTYERTNRGLEAGTQVPMPVCYRDITLEASDRLDLLVNNSVIIEIKAVESLPPVHESQLLTDLRMSKLRLGFLMNFNVKLFKLGLKRMIN
jgi:GxxExxY protein